MDSTNDRILPPHLLIENLVSGDDYSSKLSQAALEVAVRLSHHCGPFAKNAVIPTPISVTSGDRVDRFTKDGISILSSMTSKDAMMQYFCRLVAHVGKEVDTVCHDGTTTSMLTFSLITANVLSRLNTTDCNLRVAAPLISRYTREGLAKFSELINEQRLTLDDLTQFVQKHRPSIQREDVVRCLAYHEALVSSKGDVKLADAISQVVATLPEELFGYYSIEQEKFETEEVFRVTCRDYDAGFVTNTPGIFNNHALNTELLLPSCDLIVSQYDLAMMSPLSNFLISTIVADPKIKAEMDRASPGYHEKVVAKPEYQLNTHGITGTRSIITKPLVVVSPTMITDPVLQTAVDVWNKVYPKKKVITTTSQSDTLLRDAFSAVINAVAGAIPIEQLLDQGKSPLRAIIRNVSVHSAAHFIKIRNLYKRTGDKYHPYYTNPTAHPYYTDTLGTLRSMIVDESRFHVGKFTNDQLKQMISLYRMMTCQTVYDLKVGGTTYETVAARDVVVDSFGAAVSVLSDGFVLGGYPKLADAFGQYIYQELDKTSGNIRAAVLTGMSEALTEVSQIIFAGNKALHTATGSLNHRVSFMLPDLKGEEVSVNLHWLGTKSILDAFLAPHATAALADNDRIAALEDLKQIILFQPLKGFTEQFRRFGAILPNLLSSSAFVIL